MKGLRAALDTVSRERDVLQLQLQSIAQNLSIGLNVTSTRTHASSAGVGVDTVQRIANGSGSVKRRK